MLLVISQLDTMCISISICTQPGHCGMITEGHPGHTDMIAFLFLDTVNKIYYV